MNDKPMALWSDAEVQSQLNLARSKLAVEWAPAKRGYWIKQVQKLQAERRQRVEIRRDAERATAISSGHDPDTGFVP